MTGQFVARESRSENYTNNCYKIKTFSSQEDARNCQNPLLENIVSLDNCIINYLPKKPLPETGINEEDDIKKAKKIKTSIENMLFDYWVILSKTNPDIENYSAWFYNPCNGVKKTIDDIFCTIENK